MIDTHTHVDFTQPCTATPTNNKQQTNMLWNIYSRLHHVLEWGNYSLLTFLIYFALFLAVAFRLGWVERWIWFCLEKEACKILNGANLTLGSFEIDWSDVFEGKITAHGSNIVIHTPQRDAWGWEAPLIARVGKATVEANVPISLFNLIVLGKEVPIEAYTVIVSDVQCFVERRDSVLNVYLLNPSLILPPPPPPTTTAKMDVENDGNDEDYVTVTKSGESETQLPVTPTKESTEREDPNTPIDPILDTNNQTNEHAKLLVNEMLSSLQDLGRAAKRGQLPGAIKQQGLELVDRLKGFREQQDPSLEEGIKVMQQFGKVAVESLQSAPQRIFPQPDSSKENKEVFVRVGRIILRDLRIFTKDSWIKTSPTTASAAAKEDVLLEGTTTSAPLGELASQSPLKSEDAKASSDEDNGGWNKPIFIERMVIRSAELCPPMSRKDNDDLPAIYQSADRVVEVVWRRLLAEMAKSNTGKLFSTALGEVLSVMLTNPSPGPTTTAAPSP